jgi:hypothetical protein
MSEDNDMFKEWSAGVSLANAPSNEFFEEVPMELDKPSEFRVDPEQIPVAPVEVVPPALEPVEPEKNSETRPGKHGGQITLEKTSRGWRAVLESGEPSIATENFYAANKDDLIFSVLDGKLEASKAVRRLKKEKLLGSDDRVPPTPQSVPIIQQSIPSATALTADDVVEIRNKMQDNPGEAFDIYLRKRFGMDPEQFSAALKVAEEAKSLVTAQNVKADVEEVNQEFIRNNPDFANDYAGPENVHKLIARMAKAYLNKRIKDNSPQSVIDNIIYDLYTRGYWTPENLETAKEELIDSGLLVKTTPVSEVPPPQPQQVAPNPGPSVPVAPRIATQTGQPVGLGIPARSSAPSAVPEEKPLSDVDLQKLPMNDLRRIAEAQLRAMKTQGQ